MNMMLVLNTAIRSVIIVICIVGITFCLTLAMKFRNSVFAVMSALLAGGFFIILIGKALAIAGNFNPDFKMVGEIHEMIGFCGLLLMFVGLIALMVTSKNKEKGLLKNGH